MLWSMLYKERRYSRAKCAAKRGKKKEKGKNMIPGGIEPPTSCEDIQGMLDRYGDQLHHVTIVEI